MFHVECRTVPPAAQVHSLARAAHLRRLRAGAFSRGLTMRPEDEMLIEALFAFLAFAAVLLAVAYGAFQ